jgi:uncharacterized protein YccT (UPF0319 family)
MFKKITKKIMAIVALTLLAVAGSVSATTLHTSTNIDVLTVNVKHNGT